MPNFASLVLKSTQLEQVGNLLVTMAPRAALAMLEIRSREGSLAMLGIRGGEGSLAMLETYRGILTMLGIRRREGSLAMLETYKGIPTMLAIRRQSEQCGERKDRRGQEKSRQTKRCETISEKSSCNKEEVAGPYSRWTKDMGDSRQLNSKTWMGASR